ncbi:MAG: hypothetical protein N2595_00080 [bacterium]|nr:hypothetical protein [bacterium]
MNTLTPPQTQPPQQEIRLPWYVIVGGMITITVVIMFTFSNPLDTTPPPPSTPTNPLSLPHNLPPTNNPAETSVP